MTPYWNTDRIMRLIIGVAITATLLWLIHYLRGALLPFFVAILIAYLLQPLVTLNQRVIRTKSRAIPATLTIIEVTTIATLTLWLTIPIVTNQLGQLSQIIEDVHSGRIEPTPQISYIVTLIDRHLNPRQLANILTHFSIEDIIHKSTSLLEQSFNVILQTLEWMLTLVYVLFILIDYDRIISGLKMIIPQRHRPRVMTIVNDIKDGMNRYFRGQGIVALCAIVLYCAGFAIIGIPLAIPLGLLVGTLYMIPYFQYITIIPVATVCFIYSLGGTDSFWTLIGQSALVYLISQSICDYIITPRVMGRQLGLRPAIIFLSISIFGTLFGILGMIIALPATALLLDYYTRYISTR